MRQRFVVLGENHERVLATLQGYSGAQFAELKEDPDLLRPFEDALKGIGPSR